MKKFYLLVALAIVVLASCNSKKNDAKEAVTEAEVVIADTHNAQNSLDVDGTYSGTLPSTYEGNLPSASGSGMKVVITLSGDTYKKSVTYEKEPDKTFDTSGKFTWDATGSIITLAGEEAPNSYFVGENTLIHLDREGKKITGELADKYILRKK